MRDEADNSGGGNGAIDATTYERASVHLPGTGFTQADVGKKAYAVDNYTVSITSTNNTYIGTIVRVVSATEVVVALDVQKP